MLFIETESSDAAFHFSVEEYIVRDYPWDEPVLMIWQADRCAMLGCNQIAEAEIDTNYAKREGIQIVRRSSGGGTIYTDMGSFLFTVIQPYMEEQYSLDIVRENVARSVINALNMMGVAAELIGRNDILVDGEKVSGLAQYVRHGRICTHGSLLYDTDLETLVRVLIADDDKIRSKALRSIRSRVANIRDYMPQLCCVQEFREILKNYLFVGLDIREQKLSEYDMSQIDRIFQDYYGNSLWTFTQSPKFTFHNSKRFPGGKVEVFFDVAQGAVVSCSIRGDFLGTIPVRGLEQVFEALPFQYQTFAGALDGVSLQPYLGNITIGELLSCMFC